MAACAELKYRAIYEEAAGEYCAKAAVLLEHTRIFRGMKQNPE
jgi:hypothetical protein